MNADCFRKINSNFMICDKYVNARVLYIDKDFTAYILESVSKFTVSAK